MFSFYVPTTGADSWQQLLAEPEKHWKQGYSARALAHCWQSANGFPKEVKNIFAESRIETFTGIEPLLAIVEHKVPMPAQGFPSQSDLFVLAKANGQLVSTVIEGKVDESLGELLQKWNDGSPNKQARLSGILDMLGLTPNIPGTIRYQLLHRMAAAVSEAKRFGASSAVMLIHSFSPSNNWFEDFHEFVALYDRESSIDQLVFLREVGGISLYAGWVHGDEAFLTS